MYKSEQIWSQWFISLHTHSAVVWSTLQFTAIKLEVKELNKTQQRERKQDRPTFFGGECRRMKIYFMTNPGAFKSPLRVVMC